VLRTSLLVIVVAALLGGSAYYALTLVSYGPLEERTGQVTRADYTPAHDDVREEKDDDGTMRQVKHHVDASWRVTVTWDQGTYESRSESLYNQVKLGQEVTLHVRQRLWRNKPTGGWSVQAVTAK
jgi:hypothetical protein